MGQLDRNGSEDPSRSLGFDSFVQSTAKNWWLILITALVFSGVTWGLTSLSETIYRSRSSIALAPTPSIQDTGQQLDILLSMRSQLITSLARIATTGVVLETAGEGAYVDELDRDELELTAHEIPNSLVVEINVSGDDPEKVEGFIEGVVDSSAERFEDMYEVAVVEPLDPSPLVVPSRPSTGRRAAVAGTVGLGVGVLLALARDALERARWSKRHRQ
jgi:capsular polysaccharide biosynthesis protein